MRKRSDKVKVVTGALTLENAGALRIALLEAFSSHDMVLFRPDSVQARSFGCVQLIRAALKHASATGKRFIVEGTQAPVLDEMFASAGFPAGILDARQRV